MQKKAGVIIAFIAVVLGVMAIFEIVHDIETSIGFITISFGILAVIWTSMALKSLSKGSALRQYAISFLVCLICILLFAIWNTLSIIIGWRKSLNASMLYPGYVFITAAFLTFVGASHKIMMIGKEFGFNEEASNIKKKIKQSKSSKRTISKSK